MKFTDRLTNENPCPEAWQHKGENGYPISEMGYLRCDHDGCQWWSTAWPVNRALETPELIAELDGVFAGFRKAFRSREAMARWCREHAQPTSDPTEFNAWYEGRHGVFWLRMITRTGDYNLYLHGLSRAALKNQAVSGEG